MENRFEPLDGDEVLSVDESAQIFIGHRTFRVSELATALKTQLLEYGLGGLTTDKEGWFNPEGISCEALKFGANRWLKGRVKVSIDFCPDEIQGTTSRPPAPPTTIPATPPPPVMTAPPLLEEDDLITAVPEPPVVVAPKPVVEPQPAPIPLQKGEDLDLGAADDDLFAPTIAPDETEDELDFGESLDLEAETVEQAAAEFWADEDEDDDFAASPEVSDELSEEDFFASDLDEDEPEAIAPPAPETDLPATEDDDMFGELDGDDSDDIFGDDDDADALVDDVFADAPVDLGDDDDADALVDDVFADAPVDLSGDDEGDEGFDLGGNLFGEEESAATDEDDPFGDLGGDDNLFDVSDEDELEPGPSAAAPNEVVLEDADDIFGDDDTDWGLSGDDEDDLDFGDLDTEGSGTAGQDDVIADIWQDIDELS